MRYYEFELTNKERWQLKTEQSLEEVKKYIEENKWITLQYYQYGKKEI